MLVIFIGLPFHIQKNDVETLLEAPLKKNIFTPFRKKGLVESIDRIIVMNELLEQTGVQFIVSITPDIAAKRVIKQLNMQKYQGQEIVVKQYFQRDSNNDRRSGGETQIAQDRRKQDRRKTNLYFIEEIEG